MSGAEAFLPIIGSAVGGALGGRDQEVTQSSTWNVPEHLRPYLDEVMQNSADIWEYQANNNRAFPGPYVAPLTQEGIDATAAMRAQAMPNMNSERAWYQDAAQNNTLMDALGGMQGGMQNPYSGAYNPYGGASNPAFEQSIAAQRNNAMEDFGRGAGASLDSMAARGKAFGGSAYNELKGAQLGELSDSLNTMESGMRNAQMNRAADTWGQDTMRNAGLAENVFGRQMQGLGAMTDMERTDLDVNKGLLGAGMIGQGLDQQNLDAIQNAHYMNYDQPTWALNNMIRNMTALSGPQTLTQTATQQGNPFGGMMGGAMMGDWLSGYFNPSSSGGGNYLANGYRNPFADYYGEN